MDGLSTAASVAGLVSLADTIFKRTYRYAKAVKHATKEINELAASIRTLTSLLHGLRLVIEELEEEITEPNPSNLGEFRLHYISSCLATLIKIQKTLDKYEPEDGERRPVKQIIRSLKWPFSISETKELLAEVEKHKIAINVALSGDTLTAILKSLSRQEDLADDFKDMRDKQNRRWAMEDHIRMDGKRQDILYYFGHVDPSSNHKMSLKLRQHMTGLWVTEGVPYRKWLFTKNSKLWLSGIPGAGKTVIAASVIEETMRESHKNHAVAYFYCDYKDPEKQNPVNILGSLACQLARQKESAFSILEKLHSTCHPKDRIAMTPEPETLADKFREMASHFEEVSIIIDGLDECGVNTAEVVELLVGLASDSSGKTRALFLSRDESEIRELLEGEYTRLEIAAHSEDLRLYVAAEIETRQAKHGRERLKIKNPDLKEHIMRVLVERADGMFRWVTCQLDYLCSLPNDAEKRKALKALPPGLNATYERILERVNQSDESVQTLVRKSLQWIMSSNKRISTAPLCHAISIKDGDKSLDEDSFYDEEDILMNCSSLIRRSADGQYLEIAHFTVKEYLSALDPDPHLSYSKYSQAEDFVYPQLAITCLTYLTFDCFSNITEDFESWTEQEESIHPFRRHAVVNWPTYAENHYTDSQIWRLSRDLFNPSVSTCFLSWARDLVQHFHYYDDEADDKPAECFEYFTRYFCTGGLKPLHMAALMGLPDITRWLIASGCNVNESCNVGTPLHFALWYSSQIWTGIMKSTWLSPTDFQSAFEAPNSTSVIDLLIANNADCNATFRDQDGNQVSCARLAFTCGIGKGEQHSLVKLVTGGARLDAEIIDLFRLNKDDILEEPKFVEALVNTLTETNQNQAIQLKAALALNHASGLDFVKYHTPDLSQANCEDMLELFRSAIRFDQIHIMNELIKSGKIDTAYIGVDGTTFLHEAAESNSTDALRLLLSFGLAVNAADMDRRTPLFRAFLAARGERNEQCVSLLLDHGIDVNAVDSQGRNIWHVCANIDDNAGTSLMQLLLTHREKDIQGLLIPDEDGLTPLFIAARSSHSDMCELLISYNSYSSPICPDGTSLVHYAVKMGSIEFLRRLQDKGFKMTEKTEDGRTCFHYISANTTTEIVRHLMDYNVDVSWPALNGETPLHVLACLSPIPDDETLDFLFDTLATDESINSTTADGFTPLHYTIHPPSQRGKIGEGCGRTKQAKSLILRGANLHIRLPTGQSCLNRLIMNYVLNERQEELDLETPDSDSTEIFAASASGQADMRAFSRLIISYTTDLEMLTELIDGEWDNDMQQRPLNWFIWRGEDELINLLLEKGIDVDLCNTGNRKFNGPWRAIDCACFYGCSTEVFLNLLKRTSCLHVHDIHGYYLHHKACMESNRASPDILEILWKAGLDLDMPTANVTRMTPLMIAARDGRSDQTQKLIDCRADIHVRSAEGGEAVHYAARYGQCAIIEQFLQFDVDYNSCLGDNGFNILHYAAMGGHYKIVDLIVREHLIEDLNSFSYTRDTGISLAVLNSHIKTTKLLLTAGVDVDVVGQHGKRPIHDAARLGNLNIIRQLLDHNCSLEPDHDGLTPQMTALKFGHQEAYQMLQAFQLSTGGLSKHSGILSLQRHSEPSRIDRKNSEILMRAIKNEDLKLCQAFINAGFSIHRKFPCGCTPLISALFIDNKDITGFLFENGASLKGRIGTACAKQPQNFGASAIHLACLRETDADLLRRLLTRDHSIVSLAFQTATTPLHVAVQYNNIPALELLLEYWERRYSGDSTLELEICNTTPLSSTENQPHWSTCPRNQNTRSEEFLRICDVGDAGTPLHLAARLGHTEVAKCLLRHGVNIDPVDTDSNTPLHVACNPNGFKIAQLLLDRGANPLARDLFGSTPAMHAAAGGQLETLELLLRYQKDLTLANFCSNTVLHLAGKGGPKVFSYLLGRGCSPYTENSNRETPLQVALLWIGRFPSYLSLLFNTVDFNRPEGSLSIPGRPWIGPDKTFVGFYLKRATPLTIKRQLEAITWRNGNILSDVAQDGQVTIAKLLVRAGANLELDQGRYGTPLLNACTFGRLSMVKYLVRAGAKINGTKGGIPFSAIDAARPFPRIVQWLLVERHMDQLRIGYSERSNEGKKLCAWSGTHHVRVEIDGLYSPTSYASSLDHATELATLRKKLQGTVVFVSDFLDDECDNSDET